MINPDLNVVDAVFDRLSPVLCALPAGRVRPPFYKDYGQREFHVKDPDNWFLLFGAAISVRQ